MAQIVNFGPHSGPNHSDSSFPSNLTEEAHQDLLKSGLTPHDILARQLDATERAVTNCSSRTRGYVIPYLTISGSPTDFYRVKVLTPQFEEGAKYKQPRKTENYLYFPPNFHQTVNNWVRGYNQYTSDNTQHFPLVIMTEGEKKAACATKLGIPCIGMGGVYSWKTRTLVLPKETELSTTANQSKRKVLKATLPGSDMRVPELEFLAQGFGDFLDTANTHNLTVVIIFDSDRYGKLSADVQRAATLLGYELRYLGLSSNRVKCLVLPGLPKVAADEADEADTTNEVELDKKTGLDDYLMASPNAPRNFVRWLKEVYHDPDSFPKHPNPKGFLNHHLNGPLSRKQLTQLSSVLLTELDASGTRYRECHSGQPFYFDRSTHKLIPAQIAQKSEAMHETPFGTMLYRKFGLSGQDSKLLTVLASQFTGEEPIEEVTPRRVRTLITEREDPLNPFGIAIQLSDSQYIAVSPNPQKPIEVLTNGSKGILFEQNQVDPLDIDLLLGHFDELRLEGPILEPWWRQVLEETNVGAHGEANGEDSDENKNKIRLDTNRMRDYATLLFYISPYLQRWRGIQLPVELAIGEAGSGKSSLYSLRLQILTGRPHLRNIPNDLKDWNASITNSGGLLVFDNVHFTKKDLKQQISDEVCRLITEPSPHLELRKYFTTNTLVRIPVDVTFAFTAIQQPFQNADFFQRSAIFELVKLGSSPDGYWVDKQMEGRGGREAWVAHHLVFLHRFLRIASRDGPQGEGWSASYKSSHRLANLEQALEIAGKVLGIKCDWAGEVIQKSQSKSLSEADWTFEAITAFVAELRKSNPDSKFFAKDIYDWAQGQPEYESNPFLQSTRRLGRYISSHQDQIKQSLRVVPGGLVGNAVRYKLLP